MAEATAAPGRAFSLRARIILIVLGAGVLPLAVVGAWLTRSGERAGEELLASRLDTTLTRVAQEVGERWVRRRSALLDLAADSSVQALLGGGVALPSGTVPVSASREAIAELRDAAHTVMISGTDGRPLLVLGADSEGAPQLIPAAESLRVAQGRPVETILVQLAVLRGATRERIGGIAARMRVASLLPAGAGGIAGAGAVIAVVERPSGTSVVPLPFDPALLQQERFTWAGTPWLAARRELADPEVDLFAAAPLDIYTLPFQRAARTGLIWLLVVVFAATLATTVLTRRVTLALGKLTRAAEAVARGDLDRQVDVTSRDELGVVARAFDTMAESLRRTLRELSERRAIAAVGEFASSLAHEVRNPLTAMRINLQRIEEDVEARADAAQAVRQVLRDIDRLDRTVAGALKIARSGTLERTSIDLLPVVHAAARTAAPEFAAHGASLASPSANAPVLRVAGNAAGLEQVFLNLLLNAAQSLDPGGRASIQVIPGPGEVVVEVRDNGRGMSAEQQARAFEPFFTTRPEGSGLGLSVARQIVAAHGGTISLESGAGSGTAVRVILPALTGPDAAGAPAHGV